MWEVEYTDEFEAWWSSLSGAVQEAIAHDVEMLSQVGPGLGRPQVDTVKGSPSILVAVRFCSLEGARAATQDSMKSMCPGQIGCTLNTSRNSRGKD